MDFSPLCVGGSDSDEEAIERPRNSASTNKGNLRSHTYKTLALF